MSCTLFVFPLIKHREKSTGLMFKGRRSINCHKIHVAEELGPSVDKPVLSTCNDTGQVYFCNRLMFFNPL